MLLKCLKLCVSVKVCAVIFVSRQLKFVFDNTYSSHQISVKQRDCVLTYLLVIGPTLVVSKMVACINNHDIVPKEFK